MKFKKSISFVLTLCMVLSLFATFVIPVAAEEVPFEDGDNVVISYPKDGTAISTEVDYYEAKDQYRLKATELENGAVFTVDITENGTYFICDGKYLTSGETGSNLTLEEEANEYSLWEVEAAENGWYIKNVNAAYYGKPQYIEYYYAFTTYSLKEAQADIYTFQFIVQAKPATSQVVTNWNTSEWGSADEAHIFTDAEAYAAATHAWWFHAAFAPTETEGVYEVTAVRAPNTVEAAPYLAIPENGFVWVAHDTAAAGTAGAYSVAIISNLAKGNKVAFTGLDIANCTTTEDATAEKVVEEPVVDPDAPVSIALGKTYTYPTDGLYFHWSDEWPCTDNVATALTDGEKVAGYYGVGTTSGWGGASPNPLEVVIDLEAVYSIDSFAYTVCGGVDGISMPASVAIYVSEDGENFTAVDVTIVDGELVCPIGWTTCADRTSVATAAAAVEGRYVKFSFTKEGNFVFINELEVFGEAVASDEPEAPVAGLVGETVSQWGSGAGFDVLTDGYNGVGEVNNYDPFQSVLYGVSNSVVDATKYTLTFVLDEQTFNTITLYTLDFANGGVMLPDAVTFVVNGFEYEAVINANENGIATIVADLGEDVTADVIVANVAMGASPYSFPIFNMFTEIEASYKLPEGATGLDVYGYTHTFLNYVMYVDADMTLGELTAKYYGSAKDLNYFKVIVVNEDGTVAATYLDLDRNTNPASVKTDIAVTAGQVVLALSANEANVGRHEIADTVNVGDIVTLYNIDFSAEPGELANAGFTVEAAPVVIVAGLAGANVSQWGSGAGFDVLTDGYNGVGEVDNYDPYQSKLFGVASGVMEATDYTLTFVVDKQDFNTITLYALDFANGGVMLPDAVTFVVNGVEYEAVINANENGIATIVADLGETVTADAVVANVAMGASPYSFPIFNMFTEIELSIVEAPALDEVDGGELPAHNPRAGSLPIAANTAITYTVAFEHGANFNLWSEDVTVLVNGEALEMGMLGYVATLAKGDKVTIVNAGAAAVEIYPSIAPVIPGTMSSPIVLDELGDITANVTEDIVMDNGAVFYLYTATANGTLTITMPEGNWTYTVNNLTAGLYADTQWSDSDPVLSTYSIEVSAGDEIQIIVGTYNPDEPWTAPVGELTFNAAFEANVVVSQVVENFNHADWNTGINTFHAAYIFTDAEIYAGVDMTWWYHASFAPTANGGYVVVEVAAPGSDAATNNTLVIPEGGFVWVAWTSSEEGYGASSGAYAKAIMSGLKAGDIVLFNGLDIANCTTTADASATVLAPAADMDLLVSHNYNYSWHCFETQIISGLVPDAPKTAGDAPNMAGYVQDGDILYIVENVGGAYLVTGVVGGKDAILATAIPEGGFLYYVTSNCTGYDAICHGELIGKYLLLGDIDLSTTFAIDPSKDPAYTMKAVSGFGNGDVNLNGEIDATDYAILRKLVLGTITAEDLGDVAYGVADVNGDGKVNARDYYLVKRAFLAEDNSILGWEVKEDDAE